MNVRVTVAVDCQLDIVLKMVCPRLQLFISVESLSRTTFTADGKRQTAKSTSEFSFFSCNP